MTSGAVPGGAAAAPEEQDVPGSQLPPPPPGRSRLRWDSLWHLSDRTPLRTKLITAVLALVIAALAAISVTSVYVLRNYLTTQSDSTLQSNYQSLARHFPSDFSSLSANSFYALPGQPSLFGGFLLPGDQLSPAQPGSGQTFAGQGGPSPVPSIPANSQQWATANSGQLLTLGSQSGPDIWRVIVTPATAPVGNQSQQTSGTLIVALNLGNIDAAIRRLITVDLIVSGGILIILALVTIGVVRANLRPLDDIELTAGQIAAGHLDHRVPERDPRTEIGRLGRSLNAMLSQIEVAFRDRQASEEAAHRSEERMRRFIADASHELRTPLTTIRGFAEYYRQRGGVQAGAPYPSAGGTQVISAGMSSEELDRIMARLESEASRMGLLVEDLLQLARLDQQRPLDMHPVDLLTLAADAVQDARIVAPGRRIDLTVAPGAAFLVEGDEQRLRQVIGNLVNNALTHTPTEASIQVAIGAGALQAGAPAVVLDVIDNGQGMTPEQAQRVFERFYRADAARNRASGGTGLGLAIVAGLVAAHGGEVSVTSAPGEGADFRVKLPLSPDALSGQDDLD
ncbi:MAG TPA: HAMP domain-containing sensor histidine kinase [Trebonia sp.]|jgi:two-component system OmpR family sensor kinase|nr:HAMP domain-containing sensor histidine kinase [Trebonia sp.]